MEKIAKVNFSPRSRTFWTLATGRDGKRYAPSRLTYHMISKQG
jgi:hypothetical protein